MPSFGIHLIVLDEVTTALGASRNPQDREAFRLLTRYPEFASFGAVGPDIGFFLGSAPQLTRGIEGVYTWLNKVGEVFQAADSLTGVGLPNLQSRINQIGATVDTLLVDAETTLLDSIMLLATLFHGPLVRPSPIEFNEPEREWNWGDLLHWRVTGQLVKDILNEGRRTGREEWTAYGLGYITHLATDTLGHAYTNQVVGGPGRAWGIRHHLAENFMDSYTYPLFKNQEMSNSKIYQRFEGVKDSGKLEAWASMMTQLLNLNVGRTWASNQLPPEPDVDALTDAYDSMIAALKLVTNLGYLPAPKFPGISLPPLPGGRGSFTRQAISGFPPRNRSWSFWDFLKAIFRSVLVGLAFVADLLRLLADIATGIATYPFAAALYQIQLALYGVYRAVNYLLVIMAVAFPLQDELNSGLGRQFVPCRAPDAKFPWPLPKIETLNQFWQFGLRVLTVIGSNYYYLNYPSSLTDDPPELPLTLSSPYANEVPAYFIDRAAENPAYVAAWRAATSPSDIDSLNENLRSAMYGNAGGPNSVPALGNARDFALKMIRGEQPIANFNLDSDRGYGYLLWRFSGGLPAGPVNGIGTL